LLRPASPCAQRHRCATLACLVMQVSKFTKPCPVARVEIEPQLDHEAIAFKDGWSSLSHCAQQLVKSSAKGLRRHTAAMS
jgi:hypothetical protein